MTQPTISAERIEEMRETARSYIGANGYDPDPEEIIEILTELSALRAQAQGGEAVAAERDRLIEDCEQYKGAASAYFLELLELRHASPPVQAQPQGVVVKALEWWKSPHTDMLSRSEAVVGTYRVWTHHEANGVWFWHLAGGPENARGEGTEQECFADAQADYERRVLSALATPPAPVDGGWLVGREMLAEAASDNSLSDAAVRILCTARPGQVTEQVQAWATAALTASRAAVAQDETP